MASRSDITPELCRQLLRYEPETGKLFWLPRPREMFPTQRGTSTWNSRYANQEAFTALSRGYHVGRIFDMMFRRNRLAWVIHHGEWPIDGYDVDHVNGNPSDDRIANLRAVPHHVNNQNNRKPTNNSSGFVGVSPCKKSRKWEAYITANKKHIRIGTFDTLEAASVARKAAEVELGFHPNHGR